MSAYGAIHRPTNGAELLPTLWRGKIEEASAAAQRYLTIHHLTIETVRKHGGLLEHLHAVFAKEVDDGMTYPQEGEMDFEMFKNYFFAADVLMAIVGESDSAFNSTRDSAEIEVTVEEARNGRSWDDCVAGFYYVSRTDVLIVMRIAPTTYPGQTQLSWTIIPCE